MGDGDFQKFLAAVRRGDREMATDLIRQYEPYIRRVIHMKLTDHRARYVVDSIDICQSVMADFFAQAEPDRFKFRTPEDLRRLLVTMALNKLRNWVRHERHVTGIPDNWDFAAADPTPSRVAATQEEVNLIKNRLPETEARLFERYRIQGQSWKEIARDEGGEPDALRMRLMRAVARVLAERDGGDLGYGK
jgi:RNA polymerase sigma-70 factor (ECF subfamily)